MTVEINIPSTDQQGRVFLTWVPIQATARVTSGGGASVGVTLRSAGTVGGLVFDTVRSDHGTATLHLHLSPAVARKLAHLGHVTMTIRLALVAAGNQRFAIDAAGRY